MAAGVGIVREFEPDRVVELGWRHGAKEPLVEVLRARILDDSAGGRSSHSSGRSAHSQMPTVEYALDATRSRVI